VAFPLMIATSTPYMDLAGVRIYIDKFTPDDGKVRPSPLLRDTWLCGPRTFEMLMNKFKKESGSNVGNTSGSESR
jgi:hypothetical protein